MDKLKEKKKFYKNYKNKRENSIKIDNRNNELK